MIMRFISHGLTRCNLSSPNSAIHDICRRCIYINRGERISPSASFVQKMPQNIRPYLEIMRVDKPIGTWLLYWPCTWSIALASPAGCLPSTYMLGIFGAGSFLMRSAGCVINDLWDKSFDKKVERTKRRPLACGSLTEKQAIGLLSGLLSASLTILLQLNWYSVAVGASSMIFVVGYPLAKRFTYWPQLVLGATLNWSVLIVWAEIEGGFTIYFPLYSATILHTMIYDTIYSHQDKADDLMIGVKSTALRMGDDTKKWLSLFGCGTIGCLSLVGLNSYQTWPYWLALAGTAGHLGWQIRTVNINDGRDCWNKFKSNSWLGAILFIGIVASNLLKEEEEKEKIREEKEHNFVE